MKVTDIRKYSLLTFCALKNNFLAMKIIYEHARHTNEAKGRAGADQEWANFQTDRGYSAIHFAAFHGNINMVNYLIDVIGADMYARSASG